MPTVCRHFQGLESRVLALAAKFVDDQVAAEANDPASFQPDLDRLAAFRLLAHAEIEEFLEAKAREGLAAFAASIGAGCQIKNLAALFALANFLAVRFTVAWPFDLPTFLDDAQKAIRKAEEIISENNGVKGGSYFGLSIMAGKFPDEIDSALGASLTSYGTSRGDVAHRSVSRVRTLLAPSAEAKTVTDLVKALSTYFDVVSV